MQIPWKGSGGGVLQVHKAYDFKRLEAGSPLIKGHQGQVTDFDFSPYNDNLLASSAEDGIIRMWAIPDEGLTKDVLKADADLIGHQKKAIFVKFHPSADYTLASAGADKTVRVWDVQKQTCAIDYKQVSDQAYSLEWSANGSLLGATSKDKFVFAFDPR